MLAEMELEMQVIKMNLKEAKDMKKSYVNQHRAFKEFQVGENVYLHINPKSSSLSIGSCAKLAPQYCGYFDILERIGPMEYRIELPPSVKFHDVFHVLFLKIYVQDVYHLIDWYVL